MDTPDDIRPNLFACYVSDIANHLHLAESVPLPDAEAFAKKLVIEKSIRPTVTSVDTIKPGVTKEVTTDLWAYTNKHRKNIITPSGSIYTPAHVHQSLISAMVGDKLALRKKVKKVQLEARAAGNKALAKLQHFKQATIKINVNSLPGGFGSVYNIFYDKGNYNAITSGGRGLITSAYIIAEQLLGGNFAWFNNHDLMVHVISALKKCPDEDRIDNAVTKYNLKVPTRDDLLHFYQATVRNYQYNSSIKRVSQIVGNLDQYQITYLYYLGNLRHLFWDNNKTFNNMFRNMLNFDEVDYTKKVEPEDIYKLDGDLVILVNTNSNGRFDGISPYDLPEKDPKLAKEFVSVANHIQGRFTHLTELFETFVLYDHALPNVNTRKSMKRNTVTVSDTDSVIFTTKDWIQWYTGDELDLSQDAYGITSLMIYWLTKAVAHRLYHYSVQLGARDGDTSIMAMKNEFFYPSMVVYDIKKTYAGIILFQEGNELSEPDEDIKGANIRSSIIPLKSTEFTRKFIIEKILGKGTEGKLSARQLIRDAIEFENHVRETTLSGEPDYLKVVSIKTKDNYAEGAASNLTYYTAWHEMFAHKYGSYELPVKTFLVKLLKPTPGYMEWLQKTDPVIYEKMVSYIDRNQKMASAIALNLDSPEIPKELAPLIDIREIIFYNIRPIHLTLKQHNISVGMEKKRLLFQDIYKTTDQVQGLQHTTAA